MTAAELLIRAEELGISMRVDGSDLVVRYEAVPPPEFVQELRRNKPEVLALLSRDITTDPVACRGCAAVIPAGTTLCSDCGSKHSPLVRYAIELTNLAHLARLRGQALAALDRRRYPMLRLADGSSVGPGLIAWCPVLRDVDANTLREIARLAARAPKGNEDD